MIIGQAVTKTTYSITNIGDNNYQHIGTSVPKAYRMKHRIQYNQLDRLDLDEALGLVKAISLKRLDVIERQLLPAATARKK